MNKRFLTRSLVAIGCLLVVGVGAQQVDFANDRAISNITTLLSGCVICLLLLIHLYLWFVKSLPKLAAALFTIAIAGAPWIFFSLKGFTGEVVPIVELRFRDSPKPQSIAKTEATAGEEAVTPYTQFLGTARNAIVNQREFEIPQPGEYEELWRIPVGEAWSSMVLVDHRCVTMEQRDNKEAVTCYDLADGKLIWIHEVPARHQNPLGGLGPRSTPAVVDGKVYTQGATGIVRCNDLATGQLVWQEDLLQLADWSQAESEGSITWGRSGSPLVVNELCIVPFGRSGKALGNDLLKHSSLIAFDRMSGEVRWTAGDDQISYASPVLLTIDGVEQVVAVNETTVTGHDPATGEQWWSIAWYGESNGRSNCASAMQLADDRLLIAKGYSVGCGVFTVKQGDDGWTTTEQWTDNRLLKTKFTHACLDGTTAYGLSDGTLECVDLTEPKRLWSQPRDSRYGHGQALRVEDCLVIQAESGEVAFVACDPETFRVLVSIPALSSKTWNVPTIAGRYLIARNEIEAVLYRLPERSKAVE